jgi:hypothetical protein
MNHTKGQYITAYMSVFTGTGKANRDEGNDIDRSGFANDYALYAFDLTMNHTKGQYITAYMSVFTGTGKANRDEGNDIDRSGFANGYALYAFDLTPDLSENYHFNLTRQGTLRVKMKFATALPHTITLLFHSEFDKSRN